MPTRSSSDVRPLPRRLQGPIRKGRLLVATGALLAVAPLALSRDAQAEEPSQGPSTLVFYVDSDSAQAGRYAKALGAIRAQLVDTNVRVQVEEAHGVVDVRQRMDQIAAAPRGVATRVGALWLDLGQPLDLFVFVADSNARRALVRRIHLAPGAEGAAFEEMGIIVRSTVRALQEGRVIGIEAPSAVAETAPVADGRGLVAPPLAARPPTAMDEPPARPPTKPFAVGEQRTAAAETPRSAGHEAPIRLLVAYVGTTFAPGVGWQSGVTLSARYTTPFRGYLSASYDVFPVAATAANGVTLNLARHPASVAAGYDLPVVQSRVRLAGEVALMADSVGRSADASPGFTPTPSASRWLWAVAPRVRLTWRLAPRVWLSGGAGVDFALNHFDYLVAPASRVLGPYTVRPRGELGVGVDLF